MAELRDRLIGDETFGVSELLVDCLEGGIRHPGDQWDLVPHVASTVLRKLGRLDHLPNTYEELAWQIDVAWLERPDDTLTRLSEELGEVQAWSDETALAVAQERYQNGMRHYRERLKQYWSALERAHQLRTALLSLIVVRTDGMTDDTLQRLLSIRAEALRRVELAICQLTDRVGESPTLVGTGAEYRREEERRLQAAIDKARKRPSRAGKVAEAYQLLQALADVITEGS